MGEHQRERPNRRARVGAVALALAVVLAACSSSDDDATGASTPPTSAVDPAADVPISQLQVIGSHNSYHLSAQAEIGDALGTLAPDFWAQLDYSHEPIPDQLDTYGIRQLEIDVFADPEGGRFADREALPIVGLPPESGLPELDEPGYKVLHIQDFDFATTCLTFVACLSEVEAWSSANPTHVPVMIMVETKTDTIEEGAEGLGIDIAALGVDFTDPLPMTPELYDDLEAEVLSVFDRDQIITPDDVRGDAETLDEAVRTTGWPTLGDARGKVLLSLVDTGEARDVYVEGAPALEGRLFFTSAEPGAPDAAFVRVDDPIGDADALAEALAAGYLVRTRTDTPGVEALAGDVTRLEAALASGAQYLSTDHYAESQDPGTGFLVRLPGDVVVRCSPVTADERCSDEALTGPGAPAP